MWVRGLKLLCPHSACYLLKVAPYVGAWIETLYFNRLANSIKSHPMWVRGLKLLVLQECLILLVSHPMWVRGLKQSEV